MAGRILILADDLSGAADCAAACLNAGLEAQVRLEPKAPEGPPDALPPALAIDLDSRARSLAEARALTLAARPIIRGRTLYRKIDSTLRGHVAAEIAATLEAAGEGALAIVCPAYPATGRTVADGCVFVGGRPLVETEIWRLGGRGSTELKVILAEAGLAPRAIPLEQVRGGALAEAMAGARAAGARAVICDAETEADLAAIVAAGLALPGTVWIGSGGLTIPLAAALSGGRKAGPQALARGPGPILAAVGSASSISRAQLAVLARDPRVRLILVPPRVLLEGPEGPGWRPASRAVVAAVGRPDVDAAAVAIDPDAPIEPGVGPALTSALGRLLGRQLARFGALAATGGETARAVLETAGVQALSIRREIEPGVVLSTAGALPVVTKAGAFGDEGSLERAVQALRELPLA